MFKAGDRVVILLNMDRAIIESVELNSYVQPFVQGYRLKGYGGWFPFDAIVLEEIYNSPLYKAMKEEE
jgi:hypothetical protein